MCVGTSHKLHGPESVLLHNEARVRCDRKGVDAVRVEEGDGLPGDESGLSGGQEVEQTPAEEARDEVGREDAEDRLRQQERQG